MYFFLARRLKDSLWLSHVLDNCMICSAASYKVPHSLSLKLLGEVPENVVANKWLNGSDEIVEKIYCR